MSTGVDPFLSDSILPDDAELTPLHEREYRVRSYRLSPDCVLIRGAVRDQKPPGLYISHDPDPITVHHMVVDLEVSFPSLEIERAEVTFNTFPHTTCSVITDHYKKLEGLSIARGFSNVRIDHEHCTATGPMARSNAVVWVQPRGPPNSSRTLFENPLAIESPSSFL